MVGDEYCYKLFEVNEIMGCNCDIVVFGFWFVYLLDRNIIEIMRWKSFYYM